MIKAIMGLKGSGTTKALADQANRAVEVGKGDGVYIEKGTTLMYDVSHQVRLVNIEEYAIRQFDELYGFLAGLIAGNHDITDIFIDGITKICSYDIPEIERFLDRAEALCEVDGTSITLTISGDVADATEGIKKYLA